MSRCAAITIAVLLGAAITSPLHAQLSTEEAAFNAIVLTPVGALPRLVRITTVDDTLTRFEADLRYLRWKYQSLRGAFANVGLSARYGPWKRITVGATVGSRTCGECSRVLMGGVDATVSMFHHDPVDFGSGHTDLQLLLEAGRGRSSGSRVRAVAAGASLPLSISLPQRSGGLITLFMSPGLGYGSLTDESGDLLGYVGSDGGARAIFGAGLGYAFASGLGLHAAGHRIVVKDSPTQIGIGASWRF